MRRIKSYKNFRESLNEGLFDSFFGKGKKSPLVEELVEIRLELENDHDFTFYEKSYLLNFFKPQLKEIVKRLVMKHLQKNQSDNLDADSLELDLPPGVTMAQDEEDDNVDEPLTALDDIIDNAEVQIPTDSLLKLYDMALGHIMEVAEKLSNGKSFVINPTTDGDDLKVHDYTDDEEGFRGAKKYLIPYLEGIMELAENDEKYRLCSKIKKYIDLLNQI